MKIHAPFLWICLFHYFPRITALFRICLFGIPLNLLMIRLLPIIPAPLPFSPFNFPFPYLFVRYLWIYPTDTCPFVFLFPIHLPLFVCPDTSSSCMNMSNPLKTQENQRIYAYSFLYVIQSSKSRRQYHQNVSISQFLYITNTTKTSSLIVNISAHH